MKLIPPFPIERIDRVVRSDGMAWLMTIGVAWLMWDAACGGACSCYCYCPTMRED